MNLNPLLDQALLLTLIFLRIASALVVMPIFGHRGIPLTVKVGLAGFLAIFLQPGVVLPTALLGNQVGLLTFISVAVPEIVVGLLVGMVTCFIFYGVELSGQFLGMQIGFNMVTLIDPLMEEQISVIGQLQYLFAAIIFLIFNGHHFLLEGLSQTYQAIPLGASQFPSSVITLFIKLSADLFMAAIFLSEVALAIIARTVPQMNVFIVSFPLRIGVGLLALALSWPLFTYVLELLWRNFQDDWLQFINLLGP